jgi:hypothetical protein
VPSPLQAYFQQVRTYLQLDPAVDDEVVRELRAHAEDRLEELRRTGASEDEALRAVIRDFESPRSLARRFQEAHARVTWHDAVLAGLPFLLISALFATHLWRQPVVAFIVGVSVVGVTLNGLRQRRPPWFYGWAGPALTLLIFFGYVAYSMAERAAGLIADGALDLSSAFGLAGAAVYFPLGALILASSLLTATRRDWLDASMMLAPSVPVVTWVVLLHQDVGVGDVTRMDAAMALVFLAMAPAVAAFVRVPLRSLKLGLLLTTAAVLFGAVVSSAGLPAVAALALGIALFAFLLTPLVLDAALNARRTAAAARSLT